VTIPTTYFILTTYAYQQPLVAALSVCIINVVMRLAMFFVLLAVVRGMITIAFPWKSVGKYTFASVVTGILVYLLPASTSVPITLIWTAIGGFVYLAILMLIDKETRSLPRDILREITGEKSPLN
jgi:hypothetical protein